MIIGHYRQKQGWEQLKDKRVLKLYAEVVEEALFKGFLDDDVNIPRVYVSKRLTRALGICCSTHSPIYGAAIVLNPILLSYENDKEVRNVLAHELAHALTPRDHHGWEWERVGNQILKKWSDTVSRVCQDAELNKICSAAKKERTAQRVATAQYEVYCNHCGKMIRVFKTEQAARNFTIGRYHVPCGISTTLSHRKIEK